MKSQIKIFTFITIISCLFAIKVSHLALDQSYQKQLQLTNSISTYYRSANGLFIKKNDASDQKFRSTQIQKGKRTQITVYFFSAAECTFGVSNGIYPTQVKDDLKWFAYNCTGSYIDYQNTSPQKVTPTGLADTLIVAIDLRPGFDYLQFYVNGNSIGIFARGISSKINKLYFTGNLFKVSQVAITSFKVNAVSSTLSILTSNLKSYTTTKVFKVYKKNDQQQTIRSIVPLPYGKVTEVKIKLLQGYVYVFGVSNAIANIATDFVGKNPGTFGFGCEDGYIYDSPAVKVDQKCNQGDQITITYDLRKQVDAIAYLRNGKTIGKNTYMFKDVTKGNTREQYFGFSGAFVSQIQIVDYKIDGVSLIAQTQGRFQTV